MALADRVSFGLSLPHRMAEAEPAGIVGRVARRAEALGFDDVWVSDGGLGLSGTLEPFAVLNHAAALTTRVRLGVAVLVLPTHHPVRVAHAVTSLDRLSGGRAVLGVGLGGRRHDDVYQVPPERRVTRFSEQIRLVRALLAGGRVSLDSDFYSGVVDAAAPTAPQAVPPLWIGGTHPDAVRRAARLADGWIGAGSSSSATFTALVPRLRDALEECGKDPAAFPISKRVYVSVSDDRRSARAEADSLLGPTYGDPQMAERVAVCGTSDDVAEHLESLADAGATHLLLHPTARLEEHADTLARIVGLA
ncbi:LLM class flavin-dependent oxidoreductase [Xylanimonas ulmi]|nr:LLM class flavin-dependent oxidoreductase [Xylanibacterium ulmi]